MVQQLINFCIINSNNFLPSTSNVLMYEKNENIVIILENKNGMHICKNIICSCMNVYVEMFKCSHM
jgi:hypothetical protein